MASNGADEVSVEELKDAIKEEVYLASDADMEISLKSLRANLEKKFSTSLSSRAKEIRDLLQQVIAEEDMDAEESEEDEEEEQTAASSSTKPKAGTKREANGEKKNIRPSKKTLANKMTRVEFGDNAEELAVHLTSVKDSKKLFMPKKFFSTGGAGWFTNGKISIPVGDEGQEVYCQYQYQVVVTGSKEWEDGKGYEPPKKKAKK